MDETNELKPNTFFIEVTGAGLPEVDGLFIPSTAPPTESESGTLSSLGYWNGKWRGTVRMENLPEAPRSRIPTVTNPGESAGWMVTLRMT